jgi:transcriptional regulator with XRE-family HTH domain
MSKLSDLPRDVLDDPDFRRGREEQSILIRLGNLLRDARIAMELNQGQVAERLGVAQSEISRIETAQGLNGPTFVTLLNYARVVKVDVVLHARSLDRSEQF